MNDKQRGSEKLMASCSGMTTLSAEELEQVAGGALRSPHFSISNGFWRVFPHGIPWPEIFNQGKLDSVLTNPDQFQKPGY